jgi:hypothetical protein
MRLLDTWSVGRPTLGSLTAVVRTAEGSVSGVALLAVSGNQLVPSDSCISQEQ